MNSIFSLSDVLIDLHLNLSETSYNLMTTFIFLPEQRWIFFRQSKVHVSKD